MYVDPNATNIFGLQPRAIARREGTMKSTYKIVAAVVGSFVLGVGAASVFARAGQATRVFVR